MRIKANSNDVFLHRSYLPQKEAVFNDSYGLAKNVPLPHFLYAVRTGCRRFKIKRVSSSGE
jgi:hypothetical protein